jgi:hypothetical protein
MREQVTTEEFIEAVIEVVAKGVLWVLLVLALLKYLLVD